MAWKRAGFAVERGALGAGAGKPGTKPAAFDSAIAASPLVLVSYQTEWCAPCRALAPTIDAVADGWKGRLKVVRVDVDRSEALASRERINGVPVLVVYQGGKERWRHAGEISREALESALSKAAPPLEPAQSAQPAPPLR